MKNFAKKIRQIQQLSKQLATAALFFSLLSTTQAAPTHLGKGTAVVSTYQEGLAITKQDNKYGFVNRQGYELLIPSYQEVRLFHQGYAAVKLRDKWTFINKQGQRLTSFRYDWVGQFEQGAAVVQIKGKWGVINEQGLEIVPLKYDQGELRSIWADSKGVLQYARTAPGGLQ